MCNNNNPMIDKLHQLVKSDKSLTETIQEMIATDVTPVTGTEHITAVNTKKGIKLRRMSSSEQGVFGGAMSMDGKPAFINTEQITIPNAKAAQEILSEIDGYISDETLESEVCLIFGKSDWDGYSIQLIFNDSSGESYVFAYFTKALEDANRVLNLVPKSITRSQFITLRRLGFKIL